MNDNYVNYYNFNIYLKVQEIIFVIKASNNSTFVKK